MEEVLFTLGSQSIVYTQVENILAHNQVIPSQHRKAHIGNMEDDDGE